MYRFAIVGCGRIASRHAENILKSGILTAVCDIIPVRADAFAGKYQAKAYYSIDDLLKNEKEIDVVAICSPNGFHAEHSIKSLQNSKHVLCEKPMCLTSAAAWQMRETERYTRKKLFIVKSGRHNPNVKALKQLIENGRFGKIYSFQLNCVWNRDEKYYTDWHGKIFPDGGTLYTQFSHYLDILLWLFGDAIEINAFTDNYAHSGVMEFEDTGIANLRMKNGSLGNIHWSVNSFQKNAEISLLVVGENGTVKLGGPYLNSVDYFLSDLDNPFKNVGTESNIYPNFQGSMSHHPEIYSHLFSNLDNNITSNSMDGIKTVELIEKIYKASSSNQSS